MFGLGRKKREEAEESGCGFCVYARRDDGKIFCLKKRKEKTAQDLCASYEYDLLKHRPGATPVQTLAGLAEFEEDAENERRGISDEK